MNRSWNQNGHDSSPDGQSNGWSSFARQRQHHENVQRLARQARRRGEARKPPPTRMAAIGAVLILAFTLFVTPAAALGGAGYVIYNQVTKGLPPIDEMRKREVFQTTRIYDRTGQVLLYEIVDPEGGKRTVVPVSEISPHLIGATLATEDPRFYDNPGFDPFAILRAFAQNYVASGVQSGASTITMQLVKNTLISPEERYVQSYGRKLKEIYLSYQLSQSYTKDQLLEMYLNEIFYGNLAYGIEAASRTYFNKSAKELALHEAALLAGLPQSPSFYDPYVRPKEAKERQEHVLTSMVASGHIDAQTADAAMRMPLILTRPKPAEINAPHFTFYVRDLLERRFGRDAVYYGGLRVTTSIDLTMLEAAERVSRRHIEKLKELNANNAALIAIDPRTGEVLTMMGSVDFDDEKIDGQVNMAVAERQPGSALKPFTYLTGILLRGVTPSTILHDVTKQFSQGAGLPPYSPRNHDQIGHGQVTARQALSASLNIPAVEMLHLVGIDNFINTLHRAGITTLTGDYYGLAITLGAAEIKLIDLTFAYSVLANNGAQVGSAVPLEHRQPGMAAVEPALILKVEDSTGKVLFEHKPVQQQIFPAPQTFLITTTLIDDHARTMTYGRGSYLNLTGRPAAAKTGTTEHFEDGWTFGYTPDLVVGVWVGNADRTPMKNVNGVAGAGLIWHDFMDEWLANRPPVDFTPPPGVGLAPTCRPGTFPFNAPQNGMEPLSPKPPPPLSQGQPALDWFVQGTAPTVGGGVGAYAVVYEDKGKDERGQVKIETKHVLTDCNGRVVGEIPPQPFPPPQPIRPVDPRASTSGQPGVVASPVATRAPTALTPITGTLPLLPNRTPIATMTPLPTITGTQPTPAAPTIATPGAPAAAPTPIPASQPAQPAPPAPAPRPAPPSPTPERATVGTMIAVPNLVGMSEADARRRIEALGLQNTYTNYQTAADVGDQAFFNSVPPGHVLSHSPGPGRVVARGTTIHIAVRKP